MPDREGHPYEKEIELGPALRAVADPLRRAVIVALATEPDGTERNCSSFDLPVSASTRTHHFRVLREAGLIWQTDRGNARFTRLRRDEIERRLPGLLDLLTSQPVAVDEALESDRRRRRAVRGSVGQQAEVLQDPGGGPGAADVVEKRVAQPT
jgi:DNA-binding transcriptional ArsR family regulator